MAIDLEAVNSITSDKDGASPLKLNGIVVDGASAVAVVIDAPAPLANGSAKLISFRNGGVEVNSMNTSGVLASGGGTGVTTMAAVGAVPNANAASISGVTLTMQPADATNPGVVTTGAQTWAGAKTLSTSLATALINGTGTSTATGIVIDTPSIGTGKVISIQKNGFEALSVNSAGGLTVFQNIVSTAGNIQLSGTNASAFITGSFDASSSTGTLKLQYTDSTASPGNATINKPAGKSAIAIGAATVTITSSVCAATDIVLITPIGRDATAVSLEATPGAGSFVVTAAANATAATKFSWFILKTA